jgi:hypothetical protein
LLGVALLTHALFNAFGNDLIASLGASVLGPTLGPSTPGLWMVVVWLIATAVTFVFTLPAWLMAGQGWRRAA